MNKDMFVAGSATSSTVLEWAMSELMKNPSMMEEAQTEVREAFNGKTTIDQIDLKKLKYLKMVIKETLRFHPPGPLSIPRESTQQCHINGYTIPNKTIGIVNMWALGRASEYWEEAEKFELERSQLLCHFDWKLVNGVAPQQLDMTVNFGNVTTRKNSLYLLASPFGKQDAR
ncbi:hypothetical protein H5410_040582 [Solanum commersonii]|uniref:Cytochrome P450 n=1 Tax=Solanum commersonii TaxID=4109 RepID=A0A9J5XRV2_SOLCO|nr:hypothetical protein H5410_040582 [Solanum commersonii]